MDNTNSAQLIGGNIVRVPLAKKGTWFHDHYGTVSFTDTDFNTIIDNHRHNKLGFEPYITYGHIDEDPKSTDSHRKRGNAKDIFVEGDTLYGDFEVKDDTYHKVSEGQYEYSSGEFVRNFKDKDTGEVRGTAFLRVALTNAPFIPFGEKVQALSTAVEDCSQNVVPFVISLSTATVIETPKQELEEMPNEDKDAVTEGLEPTAAAPAEVEPVEVVESPVVEAEAPQVEEVEVALSSTIEASATPAEVVASVVQAETAQVPAIETPTPVTTSMNEPNQTEVMKAIMDQVESLKSLYAEKLEGAQSVIATLTAELESLKSKIAEHDVVAQAFSTNVSKANETALFRSMSEAGVAPVQIQKFSQIKTALESAQLSNTVIKLSNSEGAESSVDLVQALADLVVDLVKGEAISYNQQFGMTSSRAATDSVTAGLQEIISRNAEKAQKRVVK
jgi:hypothetical protein